MSTPIDPYRERFARPSEFLRHMALNHFETFWYAQRYTEQKNIVDMYLDASDDTRFIGYYDYLTFVLLCAEDLADEFMPRIARSPAP